MEEVKHVPAQAAQHKTAGPYSPVLEVTCGKVVVVSGQAALDMEGEVIGQSIEEQAEAALKNCQRQLESAGCSLADVFKVTVFMKNLAEWGRFNAVYQKVLPQPYPVRTAVQVGLLPGLLVEIEMWAAKP